MRWKWSQGEIKRKEERKEKERKKEGVADPNVETNKRDRWERWSRGMTRMKSSERHVLRREARIER